MVILGSQYAGEMKKGVLTLMMYLMTARGQLCLHSSANEDPATGASTLFFGLSGTGKTTLSADPSRLLIGDDEHVWTDKGIFNVEGGCYAKCANLREEREPEIFHAVRFGAVVENVVYDEGTRMVDYDDLAITENTRCAYPLHFIPNAKAHAVGSHPTNVILLTCDATGVLPLVSKLTREQVRGRGKRERASARARARPCARRARACLAPRPADGLCARPASSLPLPPSPPR
jgi:phosphoenolpyruvate carboxykinase (ATP)